MDKRGGGVIVKTRRAQLVCDSPDSLSDETRHLEKATVTQTLSETLNLTSETNNPSPVTTATIPYIKCTFETIALILRIYNILVAYKPITTLRHILTIYVKENDPPHDRQGAVYRLIKCNDCQATYIEETGRNLRLTEHKRATKNDYIRNHIAEHHRLTKHKIDWDPAECVTYSTNYKKRLTLESSYTNLEQEPLNRCQQR